MSKSALPAGLCILLLTACSEPLPQDKRHYAGTWQNDDSSTIFEISPSGQLHYIRLEMCSKKSITGKIQSFHHNIIQTGIWPFSSEFKVSAAPHLSSSGIWSMTVDGEYLINRQP